MFVSRGMEFAVVRSKCWVVRCQQVRAGVEARYNLQLLSRCSVASQVLTSNPCIGRWRRCKSCRDAVVIPRYQTELLRCVLLEVSWYRGDATNGDDDVHLAGSRDNTGRDCFAIFFVTAVLVVAEALLSACT